MRRRMGAALAAGALAMACGGKTSGTAGGATVSIEGSIDGETVAATDAVGLYSVASEYGDTRVATGVLVSNLSGVCAVLQHHLDPAGASSLVVSVVATGNTIATGTYPVSATADPSASVFYGVQDADCGQSTSVQASGGTVTLATIDSTTIAGSFDVRFASGDHLTGTFSAPVCDFTLDTDGGSSTCSP
jgi:hypothetical protein